MAQFIKGRSGNPTGRPKNAKGKTTEFIRDSIRRFIAKNLSKMQKDFDSLEAKDRIALMERLFRHVLPAPGFDLEKLDERSLDLLIQRLREKQLPNWQKDNTEGSENIKKLAAS